LFRPSLETSEAARQMGINPSQLHSLSRRLEEGGELERRDGGLHLASSA
jgi:transposase-like protein